MTLSRALTSLLILLLLSAQQAAYTHAISHVGRDAPAKDPLGQTKLCDKCVGFEKVSGMAPVDVAPLVSPVFAFTQPRRATNVRSARTVVPFHSRAPPVLL